MRNGLIRICILLTAILGLCMLAATAGAEGEQAVLPESVTAGKDATVTLLEQDGATNYLVMVYTDHHTAFAYRDYSTTGGDLVIPGAAFMDCETVTIRCLAGESYNSLSLAGERTYTVQPRQGMPATLTAAFEPAEVELDQHNTSYAAYTLSKPNATRVLVQRLVPAAGGTENPDTYEWQMQTVNTNGIPVTTSYAVNRFRFAAYAEGAWTAWSEPVDLEILEFDGNIVVSGYCGTNATWSLTDTGVLYIRGSGAMTDYNLFYENERPPWYASYRSREVNENRYIQRVVVRKGITHIGSNAFNGCEDMTRADIPDSVTSIGEAAFANCDNLETADLPKGITEIQNNTFYWCVNLKAITIPDGVTAIGDYAFKYCIDLETVNIGEGSQLKTIGASAFEDCPIAEITLPESVETIGRYAFEGCGSLRSIVIPDGVETLDYNVFQSCQMLRTVVLPASVTTIRENAFQNCYVLSYVLYKGTEAQWSAIGIESGNTQLTGAHVFYGYDPATPVILESGSCGAGEGDNVTYTLDSTGQLTISGSGRMKDYDTYYEDKRPPWYGQGDMIRKVVLENGVTRIGNYAFSQIRRMKTANLADSVTEIGNSAFYESEGLTGIVLPQSLQKIENYAFCSCHGLRSVTIYNGITNIGSYAFFSVPALKDVYYTGTQAEWSQITIGSYNFTGGNVTFHYGAERETWQELQARLTQDGDAYTVVLNTDVAADSGSTVVPLEIASGKTVTLDLNGHTLDRGRTGNGGVANGYAIHVQAGAALILTDSGDGGKVIGTYASDTSSQTEHGAVFNEGTFTLAGGSLTENRIAADNGSGGRFHVTGGRIENNINGVINNGTMEITGGVFSNTPNAVNNKAGGSVTMSGGTIAGCGIVNYGEMLFTGSARITGNTGSAVTCNGSGKFTMAGGSIRGNEATWLIYLDNPECVFTMTGGTISGNTTASSLISGGGGTGSGGIIHLEGGRIENNTAGYQGLTNSNLYPLNIKGSPVIINNTKSDGTPGGLFVHRTKPYQITGAIGEDARIQIAPPENTLGMPYAITSGLNWKGSDSDLNGIFLCDSESYTLMAAEGEAVIGEGVTITFTTRDGGTGSMDPVKVVKNAQYTFPECGFTAPEGMGFAGWKILMKPGLVYLPGETESFSYDSTVYPQWENLVTVTFDANGGDGNMDPINVLAGATFVLPECGFTAPYGTAFSGWQVGSDPTPVSVGATVSVIADTTVKPVWRYYRWNALRDEIDAGQGTFTCTLTANVIANPDDSPITIPAGKTVTIDLNGYRLDRNCLGTAATYNGYGILVEEGAALIIRDSNSGEYETGIITGEKTAQPSSGCIINHGSLTLESGMIIGNYSGAVENYGTFTMNGGGISENGHTPPDETGMEIAVNNRQGATAVMNGGSISENYSAGVWTEGAFTMNGGDIDDNGLTGVTVLAPGSFTMEDGSISGNSQASQSAGAIYTTGEVTLRGGVIEENYGRNAIQAGPDSTLTITGGIIRNNYGRGIEANGCQLSMGGYIVFADNVSTNADDTCDVYLLRGQVIHIADSLDARTSMSIKTYPQPASDGPVFLTDGYRDGNGDPTASADSFVNGWSQYFTYYTIEAEGELLFSVTESYVPADTTWADLQAAITDGTSPVTVTLTQNVTARRDSDPLVIPAGKTVTIDLNGFKINRNRLAARTGGYVIEVEADAALTIRDSSTGSAGKITGAYDDGKGSVINYGTLTLQSGSIAGNNQHGVENHGLFTISGGSIAGNRENGIVNDGVLTINGGSITGNGHNRPTGSGSYSPQVAVLNQESGEVEMNGGYISDNIADAVWTYGLFTLNEGEISGNIKGVTVFEGAVMTMADGAISANGYEDSMGAALTNDGTVTITGGRMRNNTGTFTVHNNGSLSLAGVNISGNSAGGICQNATLVLNGKVTFGDNVYPGNNSTYSCDVYLPEGQKISLTDKFNPQTAIIVHFPVSVSTVLSEATVITDGFIGSGEPVANASCFQGMQDYFITMVHGELALAHRLQYEMDEADFVLPAGIRTIEADAFTGIKARVIRIPKTQNSVTIGSGAFAGCKNLEQIYIPNSVTSIAPDAFNPTLPLVIFGDADSAASIYAGNNDYITFVAVN